MICHQCGHKIQTFSDLKNIRCPKCRATYVTKPSSTFQDKQPVPPHTEPHSKLTSSFDSYNPYQDEGRAEPSHRSTNDLPIAYSKPNSSSDLERTTIKYESPKPIPQSSINVSLRYWGIFGADYLESIKDIGSIDIYKKALMKSNTKDIKQLATFKLPNKKVLIGRKPINSPGFEDVEVKLESEDITISRRQCFVEPQVKNDIVNVVITTHINASNLTEINGVSIDRGSSKVICNGDFIRIGNSIFEAIIEKMNNLNIDLNKTILY